MSRFAVLAFVLALPVTAQIEEPDRFRLELTASAWRTRVVGGLQSGIAPVDLRSDLNLADDWTFRGALVWRAGRNRLLIEGSPFQFDGRNAMSRDITYRGRTFHLNDTVASSATLTYAYAGYQFDVLSHDRGHLGVNIGGAYLDAEGTLSSLVQAPGLTATRREQFGVPLIGADFRVYPVGLLPGLNVSGGAKGAPLGGYGFFTEGHIDGGYDLRWVTAFAGWAILDADIHENRALAPAGVAPRISGAVLGVRFRLR